MNKNYIKNTIQNLSNADIIDIVKGVVKFVHRFNYHNEEDCSEKLQAKINKIIDEADSVEKNTSEGNGKRMLVKALKIVLKLEKIEKFFEDDWNFELAIHRAGAELVHDHELFIEVDYEHEAAYFFEELSNVATLIK